MIKTIRRIISWISSFFPEKKTETIVSKEETPIKKYREENVKTPTVKFKGRNLSKKKWKDLTPRQKHQRKLALEVKRRVRDGENLFRILEEIDFKIVNVQEHLGNSLFERDGSWQVQIEDNIQVSMNIAENGSLRSIITTNSKDRSLIGHYHNDVKRSLYTGDETLLEEYRNLKIIDANGKEHTLEIDLEKLREIELQKEDGEFFEIYDDKY